MTVNATASIVIALEIAKRMREQRHGTLVLLSSVAGLRGRRDNFVYGSSKAALDVFGEGLRQAVETDGVHVVVARPGFVRSRMSAGIKPAPFSVSTEASAAAITRGVAAGRRVVWVPPILAPIFWILRLLPHAMWRVIVDRVRPS
jgi:decaprenylphospho-beta-D-erythro-pentofuranosid-2-ulose 2-reductase